MIEEWSAALSLLTTPVPRFKLLSSPQPPHCKKQLGGDVMGNNDEVLLRHGASLWSSI